MPICACTYPQVRIYEDFDKMSAKEVYYNEAGNKITVKLLHYPDIPPEDVHKLNFIDDDDNDNDNNGDDDGNDDNKYKFNSNSDNEIILLNNHNYRQRYYRRNSHSGDSILKNDEDDDNNITIEKRISRSSGGSGKSDGGGGSNEILGKIATKRALRKKSSGNLMHKCSKAFAEAHGIPITPPTPTITTSLSSSGGGVKANSYSELYPSMRHSNNSKNNNYYNNNNNSGNNSGGLRKQILNRRSPSPLNGSNKNGNLCPGYTQYSKSLLEVPMPRDYGDASSDDLSSEWDSDVPTDREDNVIITKPEKVKPSGWRKIRNIVQWTPFFQTYKKQRYPWVQLAGHQGNFKAGPEQGTVLKKLCPKEELCFKVLMKDVLRPYVPEYKGQVTSEDGESVYLQLQDLLSDFNQPCVMDCKIGVRTYLEDELSKAKEKPKLRKDMYEKMIQIDPDAPNDEEHKAKGVTKPRYMVWRETISSTATLGFRIEGIKKNDGTSSKDFKTTKSRSQIKSAFKEYSEDFPHCLPRYLQRLRAIRATLECSEFFRSHEVIGSSLLFVHDRTQANVWLIDFAKTITLPQNHHINHNTIWKVGSHEDGYLIGINNLIEIFKELDDEFKLKLDKQKNIIETYSNYNDDDVDNDNNNQICNNVTINKLELSNINNNNNQNKNYEDEIVSSLNKLQNSNVVVVDDNNKNIIEKKDNDKITEENQK